MNVEFLDKLQHAYQGVLSGTHRPGQVVVVPSLSTPQTRTQARTQQVSSDAPPQAAASVEDVDVHSFLEIALHIVHSSQAMFRYSKLICNIDLHQSIYRLA